MSELLYLLIGIFLPLFPLSMLFNALFAHLRNALLRAGVLLVWPQIGLSLTAFVQVSEQPAQPVWLLPLVLFSAALYAFRAISVRDVACWIGYLATSAWAMLWLAFLNHNDIELIRFYALAFSLPLVLLTLLGRRLEQQFGAAYTGLYRGLARSLPRFSGILVLVVLAITAVPLFPGFFILLATIVAAAPTLPLAALTVAGVWLLWTWAGACLLQGLIVGPATQHDATDLGLGVTWAYAAVLVALLLAGLYFIGARL